ncbi:efflux RND transporter periplasmic adaptor subunit [Rickettsia endosymbiont of Orchestes rusci]|uniref:efflux RND transporter periplasmic adaptor subunit n=1 Tax=Rickettsia endosymbiont of Orchestes rusci TaxID=3066250 RepID=UPI00313E6B3C
MIKLIKQSLLLILLALLILTVIIWFIRDHITGKKIISVGAPVDIVLVTKKDMLHMIELAGLTESYKSVEVKPLVTGQIIKVNFKDGELAQAGEILFEIDPRSFQYNLEEAEANLLRDQAQFENAQKEELRYRNLFAENAVSEEQYMQMLTNMNVFKAATDADEALIEDAKLQIEYSKITAPISGRLGEILLDEGNLVQANITNLVVINTISPIYISFSVPAQYLSLLQKSKVPITLKTALGEEITDGEIVFIDNTIDILSGTIKLKALFPNSEELLWPGQFVRILLNINNKTDALIVPNKAVQINDQGSYVFVVEEDNKANIRDVTIDFADDNYTVISSGLAEGERIVINGQLRLFDGTQVNAKVIQEEEE